MDKEIKDLKERDFHHGEGHAIPFFIKMVWIILLSWQVFYFIFYGIPDLKIWIAK